MKEFLLTDEDEFQDEYHIYEPIIANQLLIDSSLSELAKATKNLPKNSELKELFYPLVGFFREPNPTKEEIESYIQHSTHPDFDSAVYALLVAYK